MKAYLGVLMMLCALMGLAASSQGTEFKVGSMTLPLASDYISITSNADLLDYRGSGTADDPYIIEGISLEDHVGNGIVIKNTDAHLLVLNCTMENLNGGYDALLPVGIYIDGAKNVRIEDSRVSDSDIRFSRAENVRIKGVEGSALTFDGVLNGTIERSSIDHIIVQAGGTPMVFSDFSDIAPLDLTRTPSQNILIKGCIAGQEITFFDSMDCVVEDCIIGDSVEGGGLWIFDPRNITFRNVTVVGGALGLHRTSPDPVSVTFDGLKLVRSDIDLSGLYLAGLSSEDSIDFYNSTVDGKEISSFKDEEGLELEGIELGYVWLMNCPEARLKGVNAYGISAINSSGLIVEDSVIHQGGIYLAFSSDSTISNNTLIESRARTGGIALGYGCHNNTLRENFVKRAKKAGPDFLASLGVDTTLSDGGHAIFGNVIMDAGVGLDVGRNNTIIGNTIANNAIGLRASDDHNEIAHNNFVYNGIDAQQRSTIAWKDVSFANNTWDGNFWTSYRGEDEDGDGVGDEPHIAVSVSYPREPVAVAEERVVDNAPMMEPISDPQEGRFWQKEGLVLEAMGRGSEAEISFAMARELGYETPPASSLALTNVVSVGEDEFIEMANDGKETEIFEGLILTIDDKGSIALPDFTLEPGERIRFHLGAGESNETDIFLDSDLALDDLAGNLTLKDSAGTLDKFAAYWTPEETARDWFEKGGELSMNGSTEEALAAYERAVELDPEMAEAWIGKGYAKIRLAFIDKDPAGYNESLLSFERAIELNRSQAQAWNGKATVLSMMGRYEEAVEAYSDSLEIDPLQPWVLVGKANALWKLGRHDESMTASDEAIDATLETVEKAFVWFERAHLFAEDGDYNGTVEALNRATELAPDDKNFWINGGVLLSAHLGRYEEALTYIDRALEIDPEYVDAWFSKAQILGPSLGRYNESLEACERAIDIDPEDPDTWRLKGLILMNLGRDEEALAAFEEALELDPQNGYAWHLKGSLLQRLGRESEAEAALARAEELGFTSPLGGMLAITEISAEGEDEFVEIANHLDDAVNLKGWTLIVDGDETRSVVLPEYILKPGAMVRVHFGSGEGSGADMFMESGITLNDDSTSVSLRDGAGREVSFLGFERLPDGGVVMVRGSG